MILLYPHAPRVSTNHIVVQRDLDLQRSPSYNASCAAHSWSSIFQHDAWCWDSEHCDCLPTRRSLTTATMDQDVFASLARICILLLPVGSISKSDFERWAEEINHLNEIRLSDIPSDPREERGAPSKCTFGLLSY